MHCANQAKAPDLSYYVIQEAAGFNAGIKPFDAGAAYDVLWWPVVWRPFWGIYHILQHYTGGCAIKSVTRPENCEYPDNYQFRCATTAVEENYYNLIYSII